MLIGVASGQAYSVNYSSTSICGIMGSFVDIFCTYTYPSGLSIRETFWHIGNIRHDLSQDSRYQGRVEYRGDNIDNCTLRFNDLKEIDTEEKYRFRFITDDPDGKFSGEEVSLKLTGWYCGNFHFHFVCIILGQNTFVLCFV